MAGIELEGVAVELVPGGGASSNITIGVSSITGGTSGRILFDNAGLVGEKTVTGTGSVVLATSPTLVTPVLGVATATSIAATAALSAYSATGIPAGGTTGSGLKLSSTANFGIFFGSGAPTLSAAKGSLYLRSDGSGIADRAYINSDGGTTWTALTTAG